jgi:hypothetical protein
MTIEELFAKAATGDIEAQNKMSLACLQAAHTGDNDPDVMLMMAELWARMSATRNDVEGFVRLAGVLMMRGDRSLSADDKPSAIRRLGHALAIIDRLSDDDVTIRNFDCPAIVELTMKEMMKTEIYDAVIANAKALKNADLACE